MLVHFVPSSGIVIAMLIGCFILVLAFEATNSFHDTPNAGAALIGTAGFTGLPVSTTHIITAGIAGTMIAGGQGVQMGMLVRIGLAWVFTLPVTILLAGGLFYVLANPQL